MVGDGKTEPKRPMFVPLTPDPGGIAAFRYTISDDGRFALVEFVANHPRAFEAIRRANPSEVKVFQRNQATLAQVETEFRKLKANFDIGRFGGGVR